MTSLSTTRIERRSELAVARPLAEAFSLFTPKGEIDWAEGWDPRIIWPPSGNVSRDMVFVTTRNGLETIWAVSWLDRDNCQVEYLRVTPGLHLARVTVTCLPAGQDLTRVLVGYEYTALSEAGCQVLGSLSEAEFQREIAGWENQIRRLRRP